MKVGSGGGGLVKRLGNVEKYLYEELPGLHITKILFSENMLMSFV